MLSQKLKNIILFAFDPTSFLQKEIANFFGSNMRENYFFKIENKSENDIVVVGYPKSGNTWMQSLLSGILYGIDTKYLPDKLVQEIVPDVHARNYYLRFGGVNFFKSHHLPKPEYKRVILLVRDGRDVMTSYYHYNQLLNLPYTLEDMIFEGKGIFPCKWHKHISEWLDNPFDADILIVKYENLIESPLEELKRICKFAQLDRCESLIKRVIEGNSLERMREKAQLFDGLGQAKLDGLNGVNFFRKGVVGAYKKEFPNVLLHYFETESKNELEILGYL